MGTYAWNILYSRFRPQNPTPGDADRPPRPRPVNTGFKCKPHLCSLTTVCFIMLISAILRGNGLIIQLFSILDLIVKQPYVVKINLIVDFLLLFIPAALVKFVLMILIMSSYISHSVFLYTMNRKIDSG